MRWVTYQTGSPGGSPAEDRVGLVVDDVVHGLSPGTRLIDLLGDDGARLRDAADTARRSPAETLALADVRLRPPIPNPPSIRDFSAFEEHCRNGLAALGRGLSDDWYEIPVFYFCNPNSIVGPGDLVTAPGNSQQLDFELEIGAIVGKAGIDLHPSEAEQHLAGLCIMNDWSARDLQHREMNLVPIGPAKGKDWANGFGPALVTMDEIEAHRKNQAFDLTMTASVNGREYSRGTLADIYWSLGELLAYASRGAMLVPGDIIGTGTCGSGCILELSARFGTDKYPWLEDGDEVVLDVELLGQLRNRITVGPEPKPLR
jgi:2-keto-4-pentenoate hydratase/2-oxohepta-3-ene-1,7-dioic acid hydratase in catechol pathway